MPAMTTWMFNRFGTPSEVLERREVPVPSPGPGQVLVNLGAASINFADDLLIRGKYQSRPELPAVAGTEFMGRIVDGPETGRRVAGMIPELIGAFAQFAVVDRADARVVPDYLTDTEAVAFPISYQTAWFALHRRGNVASGDTVLVHAAAGGVGSATVQLAVAAGATVIGVVGNQAKAKLARRLGCTHVVLRGDPDAAESIKNAAGPRGIQVVIDPVGGSAHELSEKVVGFEGRIVLVGFASGDFPVVRSERMLVKNYAILGLHWGLYRRQNRQLIDREYKNLCATMEATHIRPQIDRVIDFEDVPRALGEVSTGSTTGRVVARIP